MQTTFYTIAPIFSISNLEPDISRYQEKPVFNLELQQGGYAVLKRKYLYTLTILLWYSRRSRFGIGV